MKKIATNTLASLVRVSSVALGKVDFSVLSLSREQRQGILRRLERVYRRHDRKFELRADLLGIKATELRRQMRSIPLEKIVRRHGFKDLLAFYVALSGKLKNELRRRGWSEKKLHQYIEKRVSKLTSPTPKMHATAV